MKRQRIKRMNTTRVGSVAKACTEVSTPERTRKVPSSDSEKVRIASKMVQTFSALRFSITTAECNSAVPASHGISEAFSTGSQNHQPPQPDPTARPGVRKLHPTSVPARPQRAHAASMPPSSRAATAKENEIEKPT